VRKALEPAALVVGLAIALATAIASGAPVSLAVRAWLLALGAVGLLTALLALRAPAGTSALERALARRPPKPERPLQLERLEREVVLGCGSAFDLHHRLRQSLREVAAQRLAERHGLDLDACGPDIFHADTWALLRPDREPPRDRHAAGIPPARLDAVLTEIESI
jgi:hypothetical protein